MNTVRQALSISGNARFILSPEDYTPYMQQAETPNFLAFMMDTAKNFEHPTAHMNVVQYLKDEAGPT